jgi:transposase
MIPTEIRDAVQTLKTQGLGLREITRLLKLSRNAVRRILREPERGLARDAPCDEATLIRIRRAFEDVKGNGVRVQELLAEEGIEVGYSTLTRWIREAELRAPPKRAGTYSFGPGEEMQHDTSPHKVILAGKPVMTQCASLVLAYSRRLYVQYYPRFTRFEAKAFLLDAVRFMDGVCPVCVIDNTSVLLAAGAGADAVIAPEILAFARTLGFGFLAHRVGHPDRKARVERPFADIEGNFLPGRRFEDYEDLNQKALLWCREVANAKPKHVLGMSPEAAYLIEKPHLRPLGDVLPPVYDLLDRVVDVYGYVTVETNRYSVPERFVGKPVTVYKLPKEIHVRRKGETIAVHPRAIGRSDARSTLPGHHSVPVRKARGPTPEESLLAADHPSLAAYANRLKAGGDGWGRRALRRLLEMKRTYPQGPFLAAVEEALKYGLYDLGRLEGLILKKVGGEFFALGADDRDEDA